MMHRSKRISRFIYHGEIPNPGGILKLSAVESGHLRKVLRLDVGNLCRIANAQGVEAEVTIEGFSPLGEACLKVLKNCESKIAHLKTQIHVYQSFALKGKMDLLMEKAQEIGISSFTPVLSDHCALKPSRDVQKKLLERWQKKIEQAVKQSGNLTAMALKKFSDFKETLETVDLTHKIIVFHPLPTAKPFREWMWEYQEDAAMQAHLFFGPEGGFSKREMEWVERTKAENKTIDIVSLGSNILRLETAFLGVSTAMRLLLP